MAIVISKFLLSLAYAMGAAAVPVATVGSTLFALQASEKADGSTDPYAVLLSYPGPAPDELDRVAEISVQVKGTGKTAAAATDLVNQLYESLYQDNVVRHGWVIAGKITSGLAVIDDPGVSYEVRLVIPQQTPGVTGRDERGRWNVTFNFDVRFQLAT